MHVALFHLVLALAPTAGLGARLEVRAATQEATYTVEKERGAETLQRYRALSERSMQMWLDGADLQLEASSFAESATNATVLLPAEWRSKLEVVGKLGQGTFGVVFKCKVLCEQHANIYVSVKLITKKDRHVLEEIRVLEQMRGVSDFCISAIGSPSFVDNSDGYWIMMPYMNGGELHDFLKTCHQNDGCMRSDPEGRKDWSKVNTIYTTPYILGLFHDIVSGVEVFHRTTGMHHIDLKPGNVMLNCQGKNCFAAVIDLGIACDPNKAGSCGLSGTPLYMPPEVYQQNKEGMRHPSRDVWALGIILYQLMYARLPPFFKDPKREVVRYDVDKDPNIPGTKKVDTLIMQMLEHDYTRRLDLASIRARLKDLVDRDYRMDQYGTRMVRLSATERGAAAVIPTCLSQTPVLPSTSAQVMPATTTTLPRMTPVEPVQAQIPHRPRQPQAAPPVEPVHQLGVHRPREPRAAAPVEHFPVPDQLAPFLEPVPFPSPPRAGARPRQPRAAPPVEPVPVLAPLRPREPQVAPTLEPVPVPSPPKAGARPRQPAAPPGEVQPADPRYAQGIGQNQQQRPTAREQLAQLKLLGRPSPFDTTTNAPTPGRQLPAPLAMRLKQLNALRDQGS